LKKKEKKRVKAARKALKKSPLKAGFKVSSEMVAGARNRFSKKKATATWLDILKPYQPAPGVLPKDTPAMAMDENISAFGGWAGNYYPSAVAEGQAFLGYPYLSELLLRGEYRRMVETISTTMTRKWIKFTSTAQQKRDKAKEDKLKKIDAEFKRLNIRDAFQKSCWLNDGFGRGHIYLDFGKKGNEIEDIGDGQDTMSKGKVGPRNPLRRVKVIEPVWTYPSNYNAVDPTDPAWYRPEEWYVMAKRIHASRLLTFIGREVPDMLKPAYSFGGLSLVQMAKPYVDNWLRTRQSVSDLVNAFSTLVLATHMGNQNAPGGQQLLYNRLDLFNVLRDNANVIAIDKNTEEFSNVAVPLGTLDSLQAQTQEHMSAISGIPLVFLLGIQPMGLNASSEGEIRVFYDWIHSYQEYLFRPNLQRILGFVQLSLFGEVDPEIAFDFVPLWSMSEKEEADLKKSQAETDGMDIDKGVLDPQERREKIINDPDSGYADLDPDDVPDLLEEEEEGLEPKGGAAKLAAGKAGIKEAA
jgi:phage-related protein (TIGR01555 family)